MQAQRSCWLVIDETTCAKWKLRSNTGPQSAAANTSLISADYKPE